MKAEWEQIDVDLSVEFALAMLAAEQQAERRTSDQHIPCELLDADGWPCADGRCDAA